MIPSTLLCSSPPGASFTRFQTLRLQKIFPESLANQLISYGSCQFPTLGFVVERFKAIQAFIPETFYKIKGTTCAQTHILVAFVSLTDTNSPLFIPSVIYVCGCLSAAQGGRGHCRVQLEKKPSLQPHGLPGALPDVHGGEFASVCFMTRVSAEIFGDMTGLTSGVSAVALQNKSSRLSFIQSGRVKPATPCYKRFSGELIAAYNNDNT